MRRVLIALVLASLAHPCLAQDPSAASGLEELSFVLGESHALRQACAGSADQFWRGRMAALVAAAVPDPDLEARMRESFNQGFANQPRAFPRCSGASRDAAADVAARGQELSQHLSALAQAARDAAADPSTGPATDSMAQDVAPR